MSSILLYILLILAPIVYSLHRGFRAYKEIRHPGEYFVYAKDFGNEKLRDSIVASNVSLGAAIFAFLGFGYNLKVAALISPLTWLPGFLLLLIVLPRVTDLGTGRTLHGFLAHRFNSPAIGYVASVASIIGFLGAYGVEVLVAVKLFSILIPQQSWDVGFALGLAVVVTAYTVMGGFKAASHADSFRLVATLSGIALVLGYVIYRIAKADTVPGLDQLAAGTYGFEGLSLLFVGSLVVVNLPWQLVDMSVWQRLSAVRDKNDIRRGIRASIPWIGIVWVGLISLGILLHFLPAFSAPENGDYASAFLAYLDNPFVLGGFTAACIAALMSTADSLLIAAVQALVMDVFYPHREPHRLLSGDAAESNPEFAKQVLHVSRKWTWILGISAPVFIYMLSLLIPGILDLFFLIYSAQLALLATVVAALFTKDPERFRTVAVFSLGAGLSAAAVMFALMLQVPSMDKFLWAPLVTVVASIAPWIIAVPLVSERSVALD
jgi:Na+/proline symporter